MTTSNLTCFGCGGKGHIERDCPSGAGIDSADDKPMWCRRCDRRTRLIEVNGQAARCQQCHPLAHLHLSHLIQCPGCRKLVYAWDENPCGKHLAPAKPDTRPDREEISAIITGEMHRRDIEGEAS